MAVQFLPGPLGVAPKWGVVGTTHNPDPELKTQTQAPKFQGKAQKKEGFRTLFCQVSLAAVGLVEIAARFFPKARWVYPVLLPLIALGVYDMNQKKHAIMRNYPVFGRLRYFAEELRPKFQQYFVETEVSGTPFNELQRRIVYERAKNELNTLPFGTRKNVYEMGDERILHSISAKHPAHGDLRVTIGGPECRQPYSSSILNVSAMSYGALSKNAVLALNKGAKMGEFSHNTGEGGISPYHLEPGGDLVWQIGTGYFSCRTPDGQFNPEMFAEKVKHPSIKMVELKLSQGAKPGHGGILPKEKLTLEIINIRGVEGGKDVLSPPSHTAFSTPVEMMGFIGKLRELSDGKPIGFKLCIGNRHEFLAICKAMLKTGIYPDFITIDGSEGGTGAAPREFSEHVGMPLNDALVFAHNALMGIGARDRIKILAAGKVIDGFDIISKLAMGADATNSARGMMFALGCIQALQCNSNTCPTGVATQNPALVKGLDPTDKGNRVFNFHHNTIKIAKELLGAMGLDSHRQLRPWHVQRRTSPTEIKPLSEIYEYIPQGCLLKDETVPESFRTYWNAANPESFNPTVKLLPQTKPPLTA